MLAFIFKIHPVITELEKDIAYDSYFLIYHTTLKRRAFY